MNTSEKITPNQRKFILRLLSERDYSEKWGEGDVDRLYKMLSISESDDEFGISKDVASKTITALLAFPTKEVKTEVKGEITITRPGVFENERGIYLVKPNKDKTRLYAKKLVPHSSNRLTETGDHKKIEFEYEPGAIFHIREEHRMPMERGKELTILYGRCICCGRRLKVAESVERGIGPICAGYFG